MVRLESYSETSAWDAGAECQDVLDAHDNYHRSGRKLSFDEMRALGRLMSRSPDTGHQLDAGWAYVSAALLQPTHDEALLCLTRARQSWDIAGKWGESPNARVQAKLSQAYLPCYKEFLSTGKIDNNRLLQRLIDLNHHVLAQDRKTPNRINGVATELAVLSILARQAVKHGSADIGWPSTSWQDQQYGHNCSNFDINFGRFPYGVSSRLQVKSQLGQENLASTLNTEDGDVLLQYWRQKYDPGITLIFGDVHLGNTMGQRLSANRVLAQPPSANRNQQLDILAMNVLDEIGSS